MVKFRNILTAFIIALALFGCTEKEEIVDSTDHFLTGTSSKSWQMVKIWRDSQEGTPTDCQADDIETFTVEGDYVYNHGTITCEKQNDLNGTWTLNEEETVLSITYNNQNYMPKALQVEQLTAELMILSESSFGSNYKYEYHSK